MKGGMKNVFKVHVSTWCKRDENKGARKFFFAMKKKDDSYAWIVTLNFLKVKEIYNEFTMMFGTIHLPLNHEAKKKFRKKYKQKFQHPQGHIQPLKSHINYYHMFCRKSYSTPVGSSPIPEKRLTLRRNTHSLDRTIDTYHEENDFDRKVGKLKENISHVFSVGFIGTIGYIQDIIFNIDNVGSFDEKIIKIPKFVLDESFSHRLSSSSISLKSSYHSRFDKNSSIERVKVIKEEMEEDEEEEKIEPNNIVTEYRRTGEDVNFITEEKKEETVKIRPRSTYGLDEHKIEISRSKTIEMREMIFPNKERKEKAEEDQDEIFGKYSSKDLKTTTRLKRNVTSSIDSGELFEGN